MINIFDEKNRFIEPIAASKPAPGMLWLHKLKKLTVLTMHFSSFHKYVRLDSLWAIDMLHLKMTWKFQDNKVGYFEEFSSIEINDNGFNKINSNYPQVNDIEINSQKIWRLLGSEFKKNDINIVKDYLNSIEKISKVSFMIKVGSEIVSSDVIKLK